MSEVERFSVSSHNEWELEEELSHSLWLNGYAVLELGAEDKPQEALAEVQGLHEAERFEQPPWQIVDGLLGDAGSRELTWLSEAGDSSEGETLQDLKKDLQWLAGCTRQFSSEAFGLEGMRASQLAVIRGGRADLGGSADADVPADADGSEDADDLVDEARGPPEMNIQSCEFWMSLLFSAKLMIIYFLGPDDRKLELDPFDEESEPVTLDLRPDSVVILRCDALQCSLSSSDRDYALCSWLAAPSEVGPRGWATWSEAAVESSPALKELGAWAAARLEELMRQDVQAELPKDCPRRWQRWMRATYFRHTNFPVAIVGTATHSPGTNSCDTLFKSLINGVDYVQDIPLLRWNHEEYYDPDPDTWMNSHVCTGGITRTSVRHAQFIDGVELFDNKFFQISQSEATGMEPQQRHILETSYEALQMAGYSKKTLMNAYIAVFSGSTHPEAAYINYCTGAGAGNVSQAIISNRTSFVLGCMGPSTSIDCEHASASMAIQLGCAAVAPNNQWRQDTGGHSQASITGGVFISVAGPFMWPRFHMHMNPLGRSCTWDDRAAGYVRGECSMSIIQKPYTEKLDDEWVVTGESVLSTIVGYRMTSNGKAASLTAPSVPAMMEAVDGAVSDASVGPLDIDAVECYGSGGALEDSVEATALGKLLRSMAGAEDEPLNLGAVKTQLSAQCEASGMSSFVKGLYAIRFAANTGNLHLMQLNPHIEHADYLQFSQEALPFRDEWAFHGASSRGCGGINTHIIQWWQVDDAVVRTYKLESSREPMTFWPGGGGHLEASAKPMDVYSIVGSWNNWKPETMEVTDDGSWVYIVTLGMNRYETFQLWLDADSNKVLHPQKPRSPSACAVRGPTLLEEASGLNWMIDGRTLVAPLPALGVGDVDRPQEQQLAEWSTRDRGRVGDRYQVTLRIAGKHRAVTWKKVQAGAEEDALRAIQGTYQVTGTFNNWGLSEMTLSEDDLSLGLHKIRIGPIKEVRNEFQIVRNEAWDQRFHPRFGTIASESWDEFEVEGPDDGGHGKNWCLKGKPGDFFVIEFQRSLSNDMDVKHITWRRLVE